MYDPAFLERLEIRLRQLLPCWGLSPDTSLRLLTVSENATFLADGVDGLTILRVHRPHYHTLNEIHSELGWMEALRRDGIVLVPEVRPLADGGLVASFEDDTIARHAVAFSFVAGQPPEPGDNLARWFQVLGGLTAHLHVHAQGWKRPQGFRRKTWNVDAIVGPVAYWGDWRAAPGLTADGQALLERALAQLRTEIAVYGVSLTTFGLVHCDLRLANLLVDNDRMAVIDFDDCGFGWFMYDFAAAVSFMEHEPFIPDLEAAWLEGYAAVAPLRPVDAAMLPVFRLLRRVQLSAWIASHAETPTAQALGASFTHGTVALAERHLSTAGLRRAGLR